MKHDQCDHESTPKARAACRAAHSGAALLSFPLDPVPSARKAAATHEEIIAKAAAVHTLKTARTKRDPNLIDNLARLRRCLSPVSWEKQIHYAWDRGWTVRHEHVSSGGRLVVTAAKGLIMLVWGEGDQEAYFFKPHDTSVIRRVANLGIAFSLAEGRR